MTRGAGWEDADDGVPFGPLFEVFQPGITHLRAEKERQRLDVVQREDGDPPWEIDLDAGTAVLRRPASATPPADPGPRSPADAGRTGEGGEAS